MSGTPSVDARLSMALEELRAARELLEVQPRNLVGVAFLAACSIETLTELIRTAADEIRRSRAEIRGRL